MGHAEFMVVGIAASPALKPLGVILAIFGGGMIFFPAVAFQYLEGWKYRGDEAKPSVIYSLLLRGSGIALICYSYQIFSHR